MELPAVWRETGWGLLSLGVTALCFRGAAWSYPQGHDTIWIVGGFTLAAVAILSGREVLRLRAPASGPEAIGNSHSG